MNTKKRLQVFVSSTYLDLKEERQAAVEAILSAGHIPAGMELFTAGDQSQMQVIKRWIDESDVYMLILGGRYGSIEQESGKSYIHLEYEYALERGKPVFAVVINEAHLDLKVRDEGRSVIETENPRNLKLFRQQVLTRLVRFWSDPRDIKLAIHETMAEFSRRSDLVGWVPGHHSIDTGALAEELARLAKENAEMRQQLSSAGSSQQLYHGLRFDELQGLLKGVRIRIVETTDPFDQEFINVIRETSPLSNQTSFALYDALWLLRDMIVPTFSVEWKAQNVLHSLRKLSYYGIMDQVDEDSFERQSDTFRITPDGKGFLLLALVRESQT